MMASRLDGPRLRKALSRMKPSALGLDGWSPADLRSLLDRLLGWLVDLLREVERLGRWPARLAEGYTALIPKEDPPAHGPVHGLQAVGGGALGGCHCVAGVLGPPGGLWFPPCRERPGWGGGNTGPFGAQPRPPGKAERSDLRAPVSALPLGLLGGKFRNGCTS